MSGGDGGTQAGPKIGRALELARKERGFSLKHVEEATKIRAGYLAELERENFGVLPAVYVQGSLKTYANFLHLDGDAMVRELKRRQAPQEESPHPAYVGSQKDDPLTAVGGGAGVKSRDATGGEEDGRPALIPAGSNGYLYLGSAVVLILAVAAAALALTMTADGRPAVSQVREPLISQAPETSPPGAEEDARPQQPIEGDEQRANDEDDQDEETDQRSQAGQGQGDSNQARVPASATAAKRYAASSSGTTEEPDGRSPARVRAPTPARQSSMAPPASPARAWAPTPARQSSTAPPASASALAPTLARQSSTAPPASFPAIGRPAGAPSGGPGAPPARDDGGLAIRVRAGGDDLVRIDGGPFDD
jgi:hypothetical protein